MLHIEDISIGYTKRNETNILLKNISLTLKPGELICLLGGNGSGKSTLLRTLAGLHLPVGEKNTNIEKLHRSNNLALVLTERIISTSATVWDLISTARYPYINWLVQFAEKDLKAIRFAIEKVGITNLQHRYVHELSDGQLQLTLIARALAQETSFIFLDEPTAHLDLNNRMEIMVLLRKLAHNLGKTILVSTHELDLALQLADRLWVIQEQKVVNGIPEDLVLSGLLDSVFPRKGFDLKTGEMKYDNTKNKKVKINGAGYRFLWTKNALQRAGYTIALSDESHTIEVNELGWTINKKNYKTIEELLLHL
ncbi:MAG: ABC transporter ATP-binding protein [Cyclobacteriaceae bacterium]|jgi:iron complex transport system ATP-binding protein|nr:ABC transporter ATP-binding protein [Cyclobacteriaceae bacterium]